MDFLAETKKRATAHTDCEIIDVEPLSYKVPEKVVKCKAMATTPLKSKGSLPSGPREKLMKDAFNARAGIEGWILAGMLQETLKGLFRPGSWRRIRI